ncbi:MAG: hypothetical protein FWE23_08750 [Chitinivibrionia bacterium]|nr:hypothetical protein [Chitinivibrionia bacterium]
MFKTKNVFVLIFVAATLTLMGCGPKVGGNFGETGGAVSVYPAEIQRLIDGPFRESVWAVGMATATDQVAALRRARFEATQQIATQFEQEVASQQRAFTLDIQGNVDNDVFETVQEIFVLTTLNGDRIVKEMVSRGSNGFTAYVLRALDANILKTLLEAQQNAENLRQARTAWGNLEERIARERAARAGTNFAE